MEVHSSQLVPYVKGDSPSLLEEADKMVEGLQEPMQQQDFPEQQQSSPTWQSWQPPKV